MYLIIYNSKGGSSQLQLDEGAQPQVYWWHYEGVLGAVVLRQLYASDKKIVHAPTGAKPMATKQADASSDTYYISA